MKLRYPRDPSETLYRRTLRAAGVMVAGAGLVWLASSLAQAGHDIAAQPNLPEERPGIGKNIEVVAPNLGHNVIKQAGASILTDASWFGLGAGVLFGLGGAADMIVVAYKLDPKNNEREANVETEQYRVPTSQIDEPEIMYDPDAETAVMPKVVLNDELGELTDFRETVVLPRVPSLVV